MTYPPTTPAAKRSPRRMLRTRRRAAGIVAVVCALGVVVSLAVSAPDAHAAAKYTTWASAQRTVSRQASASVTRSTKVTATATVEGYSASAVGVGRATERVVASATASANARAKASAPSAGAAHRKAVRQASRLARRRAAAAAQSLAYQQALATARARAERRAAARAARSARQVAGRAAHTLAASGGSGAAACGGERLLKADGSAWTCSFDDEFDGTSLDTSKWVAQQTANSAFAPGNVCYLDDPSTVSESGGYLNLTVNRTAPFSCPSPNGAFTTSYTGGSVSTFGRFSQTYGRFEVRAKLPPTTVAGLQETLWLWPDNALKYGAWPGSGEIDFAEFYSQYAGWNIPYLHYAYDQSTASWATNTNVVTAWPAPYNQPGMNCRIDQSGFNTYAVTWLPGQITIAVNGQDCVVDNYQPSNVAAPAPFDQPFLIALTQALGTGGNAPTASTPLPATTQVDYVRAWK